MHMFSTGTTDTYCGHIAHWVQIHILGKLLRIGYWSKGWNRRTRILTHKNNPFLSAGEFELDILCISIAWSLPRKPS